MKLNIELIKKQMIIKNLTREQFAKKLKASKTSVNYWLTQRNIPSLFFINRICKILSIKITDIIE